ncbi:metal ABC transporter ATP-binding protein [Sporolactobacillus nakayamae]|uniref:Zinc/manganese transport system ATP-binding protein n=1 Tax=Sporolactobacillus nakayamae TaxID=269670 RepID=A0A1I2TE98_9BACL|nr:ABC transporter ATP-binding protein [Sporolactobacillus nakayamae]SFG63105.1 zinc/manganese transport system ATP-binding protein [Sporolactobacillus nakayamae]
MLRNLQVDHLQVSFNGQEVYTNLSLNVSAGELFAVIGPNGAGKSTLLKCILGLLKPQSGSIRIETDHKKAIVGYVPQSRAIDDEAPIETKDFISLGQCSGLLPWLSKKERASLQEIMHFTDTTRFAKKAIGKLSGGERQRAFLAQALVRYPDLLLLDESTANLDPEAQKEMMELVKRVAREWNVAVIFISHDLSLVKEYADRLMLIAPGRHEISESTAILDQPEKLRQYYRKVPEVDEEHAVPLDSFHDRPLNGTVR